MWKERPAGQTVAIQESEQGPAPGSRIIVDRQIFWRPADPRPDRIVGYFSRRRSPDGSAERHVCYAYAEAGAASHVWVRRVAASAESVIGARWRAELTDDAALLATSLPRLPGLPRLLAEEIRPDEVSVVTELPEANGEFPLRQVGSYAAASAAVAAVVGVLPVTVVF